MVMGHEVFPCRTMTGPAVVGAAVAAPVEAEAQAEEVMVTANVAVGTHPRLAPPGRPTVVVPECQRMGMVKAEANNTIHRKPFTRNDTPASIEPNRRANRLGQITQKITIYSHKNSSLQSKQKNTHTSLRLRFSQ